MIRTTSRSIVFISGCFLSHRCWDEWITYFEHEGYKCIAPAWPFKEASPEELRNRSASDLLALNSITSLTDYFSDIINDMSEKPILIGHSVGGLLAQVLLHRGLASSAVAIHSFPMFGINSFPLSFRKAVWEAMAVFSSAKKNYLMPFATWRCAIANGIEFSRQKELYYEYVTPESKLVIREALKCSTRLNYELPHPPLLFTAGSNDNLIPARLTYNNYQQYASGSITEYIEFKGHSHLIFGQPFWTKEADYILHWLQQLPICIDRPSPQQNISWKHIRLEA